MEVLKTERLNVSVWHNDTFGRNSFLGEVDLDLSEWDFSNTQINEYALKARVKASFPPLGHVYFRSALIRRWLTSPKLFRSRHKPQTSRLPPVWWTAEDRWDWPWDSCRRPRTVSWWLLNFCQLSPFLLSVTVTYWDLTASTGKRTSRMETGEVQIWVKDCKSLPSVRGVMIDPFVKW